MNNARKNSVAELDKTIPARDSILRSIREHLAKSVPFDSVHREREEHVADLLEILPDSGNGAGTSITKAPEPMSSLLEIFRTSLEAVGGHCHVASDERDVVTALTEIISALQDSPLGARRIALSNVPALERLLRETGVTVDEITVAPGAAEVFQYDVGISRAQLAIAETGTLVLDSESEKHRLVSLVPPVHIAIVDAANIRLTLGEALAELGPDEVSPTVTLITGPSRTADIELTLAIGVHGPQEVYVIINEGPALAI